MLGLPVAAQQAGVAPTSVVTGTFSMAVDQIETRGSPDNNGSDLVLQARPGLQFSSRSGRIRGSGVYSLGLVRHSRDDGSSEVQNALNAAFTAEAVPGWFYVDASANVAQRSLSAFGQQSPDGSVQRNSNRTEVGTVTLAPYITGTLADWAFYKARFNGVATNGRRSKTADSTSTDASLSLGSPSAGSLLGWGLDASRQRVSYRVGRATETERVYATLLIRPDPEVRFALRRGEESTDVGSLEPERSATWGGDVQWSPNERTAASLSVDHRYFGRSHQVAFSHRLPQSTLRFSSTQDVSTGSGPGTVGQPITLLQLLMAVYASQIPDPILREQYIRNELLQGQNPDATVSGGFVPNAITLQRRDDLGWTYAGRRLILGIQAFTSRSQVIDSPSQQTAENVIIQRGYTSTLSYRLTPTAIASLTGSRTMTKPTDTESGTDLKSLSLSLSERIGRRIDASLTGRYTVFNSLTNPYREASVSAAMNMRF